MTSELQTVYVTCWSGISSDVLAFSSLELAQKWHAQGGVGADTWRAHELVGPGQWYATDPGGCDVWIHRLEIDGRLTAAAEEQQSP